jgi:hypothetical protein
MDRRLRTSAVADFGAGRFRISAPLQVIIFEKKIQENISDSGVQKE